MADIRKRTGQKGTTYQVRYPSSTTKSGYAFKSFNTLKEARKFVESGQIGSAQSILDCSVRTVPQAIQRWLEICEKEGTDQNEPVTLYTLKNYKYYATFMRSYTWKKELSQLVVPDIVEFRSWLLNNCPSRYVARKSLTYFHSVLHEMALRGHIGSNVASGISISSLSRYKQPVTPPSMEEFKALLYAADKLANSKNAQIARAWERYRPMIYLAGDTGMRPGEYLATPTYNLSSSEIKVDRAVERSGHKISVTKTRAGCRWIDLSPDIFDMVNHYAINHGVENKYDLVFPTSTGKWQDVTNWRKLGFGPLCEAAGLMVEEDKKGVIRSRPKFAPYDLRHFYASMLIEQKVSLKRIQTLMGHSNIATTLNVYGHLIERSEQSSEKRSGLISSLH